MKVVKSLDIVNDYIEKLETENKQLKDKINKAIELIKLNICGGSISNAKELLEILGDKENE